MTVQQIKKPSLRIVITPQEYLDGVEIIKKYDQVEAYKKEGFLRESEIAVYSIHNQEVHQEDIEDLEALGWGVDLAEYYFVYPILTFTFELPISTIEYTGNIEPYAT